MKDEELQGRLAALEGLLTAIVERMPNKVALLSDAQIWAYQVAPPDGDETEEAINAMLRRVRNATSASGPGRR